MVSSSSFRQCDWGQDKWQHPEQLRVCPAPEQERPGNITSLSDIAISSESQAKILPEKSERISGTVILLSRDKMCLLVNKHFEDMNLMVFQMVNERTKCRNTERKLLQPHLTLTYFLIKRKVVIKTKGEITLSSYEFPHPRRPLKLIKDCASNFPFLPVFESLLGRFLFKKDHVMQVHTRKCTHTSIPV